MKKRIILILLLLSTVPICLVSCSKSPEDKTVNIGSFSMAVDYGPYLVAKNKGWFENELNPKGYNVNYTLFQSLPPINEAFATNRLDVAFEAAPPAIVGAAAGIDIQIAHLSCSLVQEILVAKESDIRSAKDLKGKKIAVLAGTSSHYGLLKILNEVSITKNDVEIVDMIPPDAKNAFNTGKVDGWAVWPPWVEQEELSGYGIALKEGNAQIHSIMAVNKKFADTNPDLLKSIVQVIDQSKEWIQNNPKEAQEIIAKELNVPIEVVEKAWPRHDWKAVITEEVITDLIEKAKFLYKEGFVKNEVNIKNILLDLK